MAALVPKYDIMVRRILDTLPGKGRKSWLPLGDWKELDAQRGPDGLLPYQFGLLERSIPFFGVLENSIPFRGIKRVRTSEKWDWWFLPSDLPVPLC